MYLIRQLPPIGTRSTSAGGGSQRARTGLCSAARGSCSFKKADAKPSSGRAVDHVGFSFADVDAKMKEFETAGIKIVTPAREVHGLFKLGFVEDPWGTNIEVVQDP